MCKTKYDPEITIQLAKQYIREGSTEAEVAKRLGICEATWYKWKLKYVELAEAIKEPKVYVDSLVEDSLYKRAMGYEYEERKIIGTQNKDGKVSPQRVEITKKTVLPDVTAQIFWLKNRQPGKWRDKQEHELTGRDGKALTIKHEQSQEDLSIYTADELIALRTIHEAANARRKDTNPDISRSESGTGEPQPQ